MMRDEKQGGWFLIMVSWEAKADEIAVKRFNKVYLYLNVRAPGMDGNEKALEEATLLYNNAYPDDKIEPNDPVFDIIEGSLKPFNLIGRRKFVIIFQTPSNRVLQRLSKIISLKAEINVEIFPATYVTELREILDPNER